MANSWKIAIDTREQRPLEFEWLSERVTLATGDYSIIGYEDQIAIERKSLTDLDSTVIHNRDRFERELERFRSIPFKCIVVESDMRKLFLKSRRGQAHPMSIIGLCLAYQIDYDIPFLFSSTREIAAKVVLSFLHRAYKRLPKEEETNG